MRKFLLFLMISLMTRLCAAQTVSPASPLTDEIKVQVLDQLDELEHCRSDQVDFAKYQKLIDEAVTLMKTSYTVALETEKRSTKVAEGERDLAIKERDFYQAAYKDLSRPRSLGCKIAKALTIGIWPCR